MTKDSILLRQPRDLVERAEDQWDRLMAIPQFREIGPRKSGAAAMRLLALLGMAALDQREHGLPEAR